MLKFVWGYKNYYYMNICLNIISKWKVKKIIWVFFKKVMMEFLCMYKFCIVMVNNILIMVKMDLIFLD